MTHGPEPIPKWYRRAHRSVAGLFAAALVAVDPERATTAALVREGRTLRIGRQTVTVAGGVLVVGMGKAAAGMALAAERALGDLVSGGLVVTTDGSAGVVRPQYIEVLTAAHPLPDERSLRAGGRLLDLVGSTGPDDVVIALISGGGSALAEALRPPFTFADLRDVTDRLLRSGATIGELNTVRRAMSRIKAGGLLAQSAAPVYPLILSDVIGNDLGTIASGAMIPGPPLAEQLAVALTVLDRYGLGGAIRESATALLAVACESEPAAPRAIQAPVFIGDNARAVSAAAAEADGFVVSRPAGWQDREGEAAELGRAFARTCRAAGHDVDLVVGGGEATVTVRGAGVGGRNTEFALAAALALDADGTADWVVASLATDGQDGPTGVAGAIADGETVGRMRSAGTNPDALLRDNDSLRGFSLAGGLVTTGPTGTNVNDLYIGRRVRRGG